MLPSFLLVDQCISRYSILCTAYKEEDQRNLNYFLYRRILLSLSFCLAPVRINRFLIKDAALVLFTFLLIAASLHNGPQIFDFILFCGGPLNKRGPSRSYFFSLQRACSQHITFSMSQQTLALSFLPSSFSLPKCMRDINENIISLLRPLPKNKRILMRSVFVPFQFLILGGDAIVVRKEKECLHTRKKQGQKRSE